MKATSRGTVWSWELVRRCTRKWVTLVCEHMRGEVSSGELLGAGMVTPVIRPLHEERKCARVASVTCNREHFVLLWAAIAALGLAAWPYACSGEQRSMAHCSGVPIWRCFEANCSVFHFHLLQLIQCYFGFSVKNSIKAISCSHSGVYMGGVLWTEAACLKASILVCIGPAVLPVAWGLFCAYVCITNHLQNSQHFPSWLSKTNALLGGVSNSSHCLTAGKVAIVRLYLFLILPWNLPTGSSHMTKIFQNYLVLINKCRLIQVVSHK